MGDKVLIIDGSAVSRELVTRILRNFLQGAHVVACASAEEAREQLQQQQFSLIASTNMLPDASGMELCRELREHGNHSHTPFIIVSGEVGPKMMQQGYDAGVTEFFDKSHGYQAFADFIKESLGQSRGHVGRILYVEDSRTAAVITLRALQRQGMEITHVTSAEEALQLLESARDGTGPEYDLLLTDYYLEDDMTGGDLLRIVRARLRYRPQELPVLMITSKDDTESQIQLLTTGANDFIQKPLLEQALLARVRTLLLVRKQASAIRQQAENIEHVINTDTLTGTYNRRYLGEHGPNLLEDRDMQPLWVAIIDLDHLRQINEKSGHISGDHILASLGETLRSHFSSSEVVRFGGEEFAVLMPRHSQKQALGQAEKLRQKVMEMSTEGITTTVSIGLVCASEYPAHNLNQILALADKALFAAKDAGRNRVYLTDAQGRVHPVKALKKPA